MNRPWSRDEIVADLIKLQGSGAEPTPYELKDKYGYARLSAFFPILEDICRKELGLKDFVDGVFGRVTDRRDLHFIYRGCNSSSCTV